MAGILDEIVTKKLVSLEKAKSVISPDAIRDMAGAKKAAHLFIQSLSKPGLRIIAEIKEASPSRGVIRYNFNPVEIAMEYTAAGAAAISVLTEENYFLGSLKYIRQVKTATNLPVLRKDFLTDPYQIYEARVNGADAVLLIASLLNANQITTMLAIAEGLGMDCLVEVHNAEELQKVLATPAKIIGINNRNLSTLTVDLGTAQELSKSMPADRLIVVESGIEKYDDIKQYQGSNINCFLIGETFMKSGNIKAKFKELTNGKN